MASADTTMRTLAGLVAALMMMLDPAGAGPADDVGAARAWGILGTWRIDCAAPPSRANGSLTYAVRDGRLVHPRDFGDVRDELQVQSARVLPNGRFEFVIRFPDDGQRRRFTVVKGDDGRIRVMDNVAVGSREYSIRDGSLVATGKPSRWQTRCEADGVGASMPSSTMRAALSGMTAYQTALSRTPWPQGW